MPPRIDPVDTGRGHRDSHTARLQRSGMGGAVDAQRQPAADDQSPHDQATAKVTRCTQGHGARAPAAHHRHLGPLQRVGIAAVKKQRRGVEDLPQQGRVGRIGQRQQPGRHPLECLQLPAHIEAGKPLVVTQGLQFRHSGGGHPKGRPQ